MKPTVYLDYAATTPTDPEVVKEMSPYFGTWYGNTMSLHRQGIRAAEAVEKTRGIIADFIGARGEEIVFTSSATESNNLAIKGLTLTNRSRREIIISGIEHDCVWESAKWVAEHGAYMVTVIPVNREGMVDFERLEKVMSENTAVVSIIHGNNEVGVIQDIAKIGQLCRNRGVYFHTDAAQSFGKIPINVEKMNIDLLTASSHKIYGPKGAGVLYVKRGIRLEPILHGGGHENGLRSSTVNVAAIVGMGKAVEISLGGMETEGARIRKLRDKLIDGILEAVKDSWLNGSREERLYNNANISFARVEGESMVLELDRLGIMCSTGSACSSRNLEPSHVLTAMGLSPPEAHGSLRLSLGRGTTEAEIDHVLRTLPKVVEKFRKMSPIKG